LRPPTTTMSVLLETSLGDLVIDLLVDASPKACEK
jgi:peptidyl-prolyl cis-trans isomerase-like 4